MTLERYVLRRLLRRSLLVGLLIALAALASDLATTGPLWAARVGWLVVVQAALLHLPLHVVLMLPVSGLLSGALLVANLARSGELESMSACGAPPIRVGGALVAAGVALLIAALALSELVVPRCEASAARLYGHARASSLSGQRQLGEWYAGPDGWLVQVQPGRPAKRSKQWRAFRIDARHQLVARLSGTLQIGSSVPTSVRLQRRGPLVSPAARARLVTFLVDLGDAANPLPAEALTILQLRERTQRAHAHGRATRLDALMLQTRLAFPLLNPLVGLLVWAMAISRGRNGTASLLAASVGWACALWLLVAAGWQLALANLLSPAAGAWLPTGCVALLTFGALAHARLRRGTLAA